MRIRALIALAADAPEGELRSVATAKGDFLLLTDTPGGDGKGAECYLEFQRRLLQRRRSSSRRQVDDGNYRRRPTDSDLGRMDDGMRRIRRLLRVC